MWIKNAIFSNFFEPFLIECKFYETELKLLFIATIFEATLPKEEYILRVRRDEKDLVDHRAFNVFNHSLLRVWHDEKALTLKDVILFI